LLFADLNREPPISEKAKATAGKSGARRAKLRASFGLK
jgi:hypothetical protein